MYWIWALICLTLLIFVIKSLFIRVPVSPGGIMKSKIEDVLQQQEVKYDMLNFNTPALTGLSLKVLIYFLYTRFGKYLLVPKILNSSNLIRMRQVQLPEEPTYYPTPNSPQPLRDHSRSNKEVLVRCMEKEIKKEDSGDFHLPSVADYVRAYRSGQTTPSQVARKVLDAIADSDKANPPLRAIVQTDRNAVLAMAAASDKRWKENKTLSYLDGIPVSIKEEFCCEPYKPVSGASYEPELCSGGSEAAIVKKLRAAGAVIIGMTNMQEFGTGLLGSNPHPSHLTGRNPYDPRRYAGGSSTGAAISVAAGFCPVSIGGDGGGSIRVPASACGTVGLKPSAGIVDSSGFISAVFTVGVTGPLSSSVLDTSLVMDIISQTENGDKKLVSLKGLGETKLNGIKIGVYKDHFNHASEQIVSICHSALSHLEDMGAELVEITIPELEDSRVAHFITIGTEFASSLCLELDHHFSEWNPETHLPVGISSNFTAIDYVNAQKQRTRAMTVLKSLFEKVDIIVTPGVGCLPPVICPEALSCGISDSVSTSKLMRFSFLANLTGIPSLVVPVGYTDDGLPVNLQLMSSWYREDIILKTGYIMEHSGRFPARKPKVFYDVITN